MNIDIFVVVAVILFTSVALAIDVKTRRIPNWLTVSSAVAGLLYHIITGGWAGLLLALGGFVTGFGILLVLWLIGGGGGGDVKLMGAIGCWLGAFATLLVFIGSAIFAVVCTVAIIVWSNVRKGTADAGGADVETAETSVLKRTIPYAVPVALSIWTIVLFQFVTG